ncbi:MAG: DUF3267 domain-containing protein [Rubricoccaceae bacterium]|nr:DUF3267 domain-containing protein [Rubricoccaceae bacterium]
MARPADLPTPEDRSVSMAAANGYALLFVVPAAAALLGAFFALWGWPPLYRATDGALDRPLLALAVFAAGVVAHEVLHVVAWRWVGHVPAGTVRLGFQWATLTPYAHCEVPMAARAYRIGAATPGVVLGLLPVLAGLATGGGALFLFGLLFTLAAGGDALILWLLRDVPADQLVADHPSRAGCLVHAAGEETEGVGSAPGAGE